MITKKLISLCVPVLNEEMNIDDLYKAVLSVMARLANKYDFELIFTDNHSTDNTYGKLCELAHNDSRVRVFRFSRNFGHQRSILTGYLKSRGDAVIQLDCDLQDPPEMIVDFIETWENGYQVVYGVRKKRQEGFIITLVRKIYYRTVDFLSEHSLPVDAGDFRLIDRKIVNILVQIDDANPYLRGMIAVLGFKQKGIPYDRDSRSKGETKFNLSSLLSLAFDGIISHSTIPLRIATFVGFFVSLVTLIACFGYFIGKIFFHKDWPLGFTTNVLLILFGISLNALFLGIIGEYLGRIYKQVKKQPLTIIESEIDNNLC